MDQIMYHDYLLKDVVKIFGFLFQLLSYLEVAGYKTNVNQLQASGFNIAKNHLGLEWSVVKISEFYQNCESPHYFWQTLYLSIGVNTFTCSKFGRLVNVSLTDYLMT